MKPKLQFVLVSVSGGHGRIQIENDSSDIVQTRLSRSLVQYQTIDVILGNWVRDTWAVGN